MTKMRFNFGSMLIASIIGVIAMTICLAFFGINSMNVFGMAAGMEGAMIYVVGGAIQLLIGIFYGILYAWIFEPLLKKLPGFLAGTIYSLLPFVIALFFAGIFMQFIHSVFNGDSNSSSFSEAGTWPQYSQNDGSMESDSEDDNSYYRHYQDNDDYNQKSQPNDHRYGNGMQDQYAPDNGQSQHHMGQTGYCPDCNTYHRGGIDGPQSIPHDDHMSSSAQNDNGMHHTQDGSAMHHSWREETMSMNPYASEVAGVKGWLISLISHLIYGFFLGWVYRPRVYKG